MNETELRRQRARAASRKYRYGITELQFNEILTEQNNACAVCKVGFNEKIRANVDHNHLCCPGKKSCGDCLRGLLCSNCLTLASIMEKRFSYMDDLFIYLTKYLNKNGGEK